MLLHYYITYELVFQHILLELSVYLSCYKYHKEISWSAGGGGSIGAALVRFRNNNFVDIALRLRYVMRCNVSFQMVFASFFTKLRKFQSAQNATPTVQNCVKFGETVY